MEAGQCALQARNTEGAGGVQGKAPTFTARRKPSTMNNIVLQDLLLRLLEGGYRSKDKELRNAICILLSFASRQDPLPMPLSPS